MHELDVPVIVAIERAAYQFPWSEGIFRDCLRVGYVCRVADVGGEMAGYGIMSVGAGEAHILETARHAGSPGTFTSLTTLLPFAPKRMSKVWPVWFSYLQRT